MLKECAFGKDVDSGLDPNKARLEDRLLHGLSGK